MVLAAFGPFQRWLHAKLGWRERKKLKASRPRAFEALAQTLRDEGVMMWMANPHQIVDAVVKIEQSWALLKTADTAIQLGVMYDLVNRHEDALSVYREAFHLFPEHPRLRHEAAVKLLRFGQPEDVRDFFASVLRRDPQDVFARMVAEMLEKYPSWVHALSEAIGSEEKGGRVYLITCAVWGEPFATNFIRYLCAALLAPDNVPALAKRHSVHFGIFTTADTETRLRADPLFQDLASYASIHFMRYDSRWVHYREEMNRHYGSALGHYYSRTCQFLLFSCAHYAALAAGRSMDCVVVPLGSDSILSDGALTEVDNLMAKDISVVAACGFALNAKGARPIVERFRDTSGRLSISSQEVTKLLIEHMPGAYFVDSTNFSSSPVNLCWRVGREALIVHATHYHPIGIRPRALAPPYELTTDPVDGRFLDRRLFDGAKIHFVRDTSVGGLTLDESNEEDTTPENRRTMSVDEVGQWLWQVWGPWRAMHFGSPICISGETLPPEWEEVQKQAQATVAAIMKVSADLEDGNRCRKSWQLQPDKTGARIRS